MTESELLALFAPKAPVVAGPTKVAVKVGDIFVSSWGYDQTNIDYYVVLKITASGKSATIARIGQKVVGGGFGSDQVAPDPTNIVGTPKTKRVTYPEWKQGQPSIKVRDWGVWASLFTGGSRAQTAFGFGH